MEPIRGDVLRGHLETMILSALERGEAHGFEVLRRLEDAGCGALRLKEGSLYPGPIPLGRVGPDPRRMGGRRQYAPRPAPARLSSDEKGDGQTGRRPRGMAAFCDDHWRHIGSNGVKELMIAVERVVRPALRRAAKKNDNAPGVAGPSDQRLRRARRGWATMDAAREEAVRRFGNPADLTRDLQASVPVYERLSFTPLPGTKWLTALERKMEIKLSEPSSHSVARWLRLWFWFSIVFGMAAGPAIIIYESRYDAAGAVMALGWLATASGMFAVALFAPAPPVGALSGPLTLKAVLRASMFAFFTVAAPSLVTMVMLHWILDLPVHSGEQIAGVVIGSLLILGLAFGVRYQAAAKRGRMEWTSLEIGD